MNLKDTLTTIYHQHGELTPQNVLKEASNPEHPLHTRFEWDDTKAAQKYRETQATDLIRSVKITYTETPYPKTVRAFLPVRRAEATPKTVYRPTDEVLQDPRSEAILLRDMEREFKQFELRWSHMKEYAALINTKAEHLKEEATA